MPFIFSFKPQRPSFAVCSTAVLALVLSAWAPAVMAQEHQHNDKETKEDIARHRAIAAAHTAAAQCLELGKSEAVCTKQLQADCKGLAIGKFCGMRHVH